MADGDQGYGQQDPSTSTSEYNQDTFLVEQLLALISTVKIVQVKAVDTGAKTVDVLPLVKQLDGQGNASSHGIVNGIKYFGGMQAGSNAVMMDPAVGDIGLMACCDRDVSAVLKSKAEAPPGSYRKHDMADGIYIGGLLGLNADPTQWVKFTGTGLELADKNSNKLVSSSTGWAFTGPVTFNNTIDVKGTSTLEGNFQLGGSFKGLGGANYNIDIGLSANIVLTTGFDVVASGIHSLSNHTHQYVAPASGSTVVANTGPTQ